MASCVGVEYSITQTNGIFRPIACHSPLVITCKTAASLRQLLYNSLITQSDEWNKNLLDSVIGWLCFCMFILELYVIKIL